MGDRKARALGAGEGESVWSLGGRFTIKADSDLTEGRLALVEALAFRTTEPPLHVHHREDEAWYVLEGGMTFYVGDSVEVARPGSFVYAPQGLPHTFTVDVEPTRVLVLATPGGFEHFALELGEPAADDQPPSNLLPPLPEVVGPVGARYGIEVIGPPRRISHPESG
ncbi:MAG TPA: quercetin 2,3-dioxygenase [Candidatus Limnocylindrales bacterium]